MLVQFTPNNHSHTVKHTPGDGFAHSSRTQDRLQLCPGLQQRVSLWGWEGVDGRERHHEGIPDALHLASFGRGERCDCVGCHAENVENHLALL